MEKDEKRIKDFKEIEEAVNVHKLKLDKQVGEFIDNGLKDKIISNNDFTKNPENGHKLYTANDQDGHEIIYDYTLRRIYSYGGNINTIS